MAEVSSGSAVGAQRRFCPTCFSEIAPGATLCPVCEGGPRPTADPVNVQRVADRIADTIGVDRIEGFEGRSFFADIFKRRSAAEVETHFAWGFPA